MDPNQTIRVRQQARADAAKTARILAYLSRNRLIIEQIRAECTVAHDSLRRLNWPDDAPYQFYWVNVGADEEVAGWRVAVPDTWKYDGVSTWVEGHFIVYLLYDGSLWATKKGNPDITSPDFGDVMLLRVLEGLRRLVATCN